MKNEYVLFSASLILITSVVVLFSLKTRKKSETEVGLSIVSSYDQLIGNTPLIKLKKLSQLTGCDIFVKMESMNPGGTGKDRAVKYMLDEARHHPLYREGVKMFEGTSGSTGIALAFQCNALGLKLHVVMPDDQADEKRIMLEKLGASVSIVPCCAIANANHYVNTARRMAESSGGIFVDQFENAANFRAHFEGTGPEIFRQTGGQLDAFVMSAGTGGTIAGVSRFLKLQSKDIEVVLADPTGSSLLQKVLFNVCYTAQQSERTIRKHRYDSIVEGVGLDRVTQNFAQADIDTGVLVPDQLMVNMAHWLLRHEGLFVGSSSALNVAAAVHTAVRLGPGKKIVTVICDSGNRHLSRFWNPEYLAANKLSWPDSEKLSLDDLLVDP